MKPESCRQLDDYHLELLSKEEQAAFKQHLASCSNCQGLESQTRTIEETLRSHHVSVSPNPAWQEQMQATLRQNRNEIKQVDEPFIQILKSQRDWRPTVAIAVFVLAASLLLMLRYKDDPVKRAPFEAMTSESVKQHDDPFTPNTAQEIPLMSVHASAGFLCARVECDDPDIEFYVVLPSTN